MSLNPHIGQTNNLDLKNSPEIKESLRSGMHISIELAESFPDTFSGLKKE